MLRPLVDFGRAQLQCNELRNPIEALRDQFLHGLAVYGVAAIWMFSPKPVIDKLTLLAAFLAALSGLWCWLEVSPDISTRIRDDAFYEFAWAANLAEGRGPMVSDGITTSGVQWLWSLLLALFAWVWGAAVLPTLAPMVGLAFHFATAVLIQKFVRDRLTKVCLALCWVGHPLLLREAQNGQETALAVFLAAALVVGRKLHERWFLPLALLAGLARTDLFALVLMLSIRRYCNSATFVGWLRALPTPALTFLIPSACNRLVGGTWLPDSAMPMAWLFHANLSEVGSYAANQWWFTRPVLLGAPYATVSAFGFGLVVFQLIRPWWPASLRLVPAALVGIAAALGAQDLAIVAWAVLLLAAFPAARIRRLPLDLLFVTLGLVAIVGLHWAIRWYPRDYYLAPLAVVVFFAVARLARWRFLLLLFAVMQVQGGWRMKPEPLAGQQEMEMAGLYLHQVLPTSERIGCFNSGLVTWHADIAAGSGFDPGRGRRGVVNLDGVVDARSFAALQTGQLSQWLDVEGVRFLLDTPTQFELDPSIPHACGMHFGDGFHPDHDLVEVARFDLPGISSSLPGGDSMRLYWRKGRGDMPARPVALGEIKKASLAWLGPSDRQYVWWGAGAGQQLVMQSLDGQRLVLCSTAETTAVLLQLPSLDVDIRHLRIESR